MHAHADDLRAEVGDEAHVAALLKDWRAADLAPADRAMLAYAEKLTLTPGAVGDADRAALRTAGVSDRAIHDLAQVVGYFAYINRIADGLGVALEPEMPHRGHGHGHVGALL